MFTIPRVHLVHTEAKFNEICVEFSDPQMKVGEAKITTGFDNGDPFRDFTITYEFKNEAGTKIITYIFSFSMAKGKSPPQKMEITRTQKRTLEILKHTKDTDKLKI